MCAVEKVQHKHFLIHCEHDLRTTLYSVIGEYYHLFDYSSVWGTLGLQSIF